MNAEIDADKLAAARLWAAVRHPYLASALFAMTVVAVPDLGGATVDEWWRLYLDPTSVEEWSVEVLGSLLVHHTGHLLRDHAARARGLGVDHQSAHDWSAAADAEINDDLVGLGLRLPGEPVFPQSLGYEPGQLAEEYFQGAGRKLDSAPDCGSGADSVPRPWELGGDLPGGMPPGERQLLRCQAAAEVLRFCREGLGRLPATWERWAQDLLEPRVDWRTVLAAELRKGISIVAGRVDYTYRRPSRRAGACPQVILPALQRPVPEMAIVCDTSGSMSDLQLARVLAEVEGLLRGVGLSTTRVRVLAVDASVQAVKRVATARHLDLAGGGGTDMGAGIDAAGRLRPRPGVVVVLTDGMTPWPAEPPKGMRVVIGLIGGHHGRGGRQWEVPGWARVVDIDDAA